MTKQEIIHKVKALELPKGSYIVFGSCPLAAVGIREAQDIDLLVTPELFAKLQKAGWQEVDKGPGDKPVAYSVYEAHANWDFTSYKPTLKQLLKTATMFDGVPFASLDEVRKWKKASGRPKDLVDIKLIDQYLATLK